jgi:threonine dehydratase
VLSPPRSRARAVVGREGIHAAHEIIRPYIRQTPVIAINGRDLGLAGAEIALKLELLQCSGSFKVRGAFANMLLREVPAAGVVAASGGNHGAAVAYAARALGIRATVFVPRVSSPAKIARIRAYGADLRICGDSYSDALQESQAHARASGAMNVHAFDQVETMLGQGTMAKEFDEQTPALNAVLVPVGGAGLIGGVVGWFDDHAEIVAVEPEAAPTLSRALESGRPVDASVGGICVDSLAPTRVGLKAFAQVQRRVTRVVLVSESAIRDAQQQLWEVLRVVAEPGGATAFAAVTSGAYRLSPGQRVGVVLSGANTTAVSFT